MSENRRGVAAALVGVIANKTLYRKQISAAPPLLVFSPTRVYAVNKLIRVFCVKTQTTGKERVVGTGHCPELDYRRGEKKQGGRARVCPG